jgi:hypothetical protein
VLSGFAWPIVCVCAHSILQVVDPDGGFKGPIRLRLKPHDAANQGAEAAPTAADAKGGSEAAAELSVRH